MLFELNETLSFIAVQTEARRAVLKNGFKPSKDTRFAMTVRNIGVHIELNTFYSREKQY